MVGPSALQGTVLESPDIRAGMAMLIAAWGPREPAASKTSPRSSGDTNRSTSALKALGARIERQDVP